jgi:hypothetical protein
MFSKNREILLTGILYGFLASFFYIKHNLFIYLVPGTTASSVKNSDISELNTSGDSGWTTTYSTVSSTGTGEYRFT